MHSQCMQRQASGGLPCSRRASPLGRVLRSASQPASQSAAVQPQRPATGRRRPPRIGGSYHLLSYANVQSATQPSAARSAEFFVCVGLAIHTKVASRLSPFAGPGINSIPHESKRAPAGTDLLDAAARALGGAAPSGRCSPLRATPGGRSRQEVRGQAPRYRERS